MNSNNELIEHEICQKSDSEIHKDKYNQKKDDQKKHIYERKIDLSNSNDSLVKIFNFIKPNSNVLDIGCAVGALGKYLKSEKNCSVTGVDYNQESVEIAKRVLDGAYCLDITSPDVLDNFKGVTFDHIIFADVLEHLVEPLDILNRFKTILSKDGTIIISIPNIAHGSVRFTLMHGNFDYTEEGLLDKTHLRFFTAKSFLNLIDSAGLFPIDFDRTYIDIINYCRSYQIKYDFDQELIEKIESLPEAKTLQFVANLIPCENEFHRKALRKMFDELEAKAHGLTTQELDYIQSPIIDSFTTLKAKFSDLEKTCDSLVLRLNEQAQTQQYMINDLEQIEGIKNKLDHNTIALGLIEQKLLRYGNILPIRILKSIRRKVFKV